HFSPYDTHAPPYPPSSPTRRSSDLDEAVVHPEPLAVPKRMHVRLLDRAARRGANVREEERRRDARRELAQVAVVPGRVRAAVHPRRLSVLVPTDAEPVAVRRRRALA